MGFGLGLHDLILCCPHLYSHRARLNPQGSSSKTPKEEEPGPRAALPTLHCCALCSREQTGTAQNPTPVPKGENSGWCFQMKYANRCCHCFITQFAGSIIDKSHV